MPCFIRWPGTIKPGSVYNGIVSHIDMFPTLLAAAGNPDVTKQLVDGCTVGKKKFHVHLDGYNMIPYFSGEVAESPRKAFVYFSDDGDVIAVRVGDYNSIWLSNSLTPRNNGRCPSWNWLPVMNLRCDPFERADFNSNRYWDWALNHVPSST